MAEFRTEWEEKYSKAWTIYRTELESMKEQKLYEDPDKLLEWAKETKIKARTVSDVFGGGEIALSVGDTLGKMEDGDTHLRRIKDYAAERGVVSPLKHSFLRYDVSVCLKQLLDGSTGE